MTRTLKDFEWFDWMRKNPGKPMTGRMGFSFRQNDHVHEIMDSRFSWRPCKADAFIYFGDEWFTVEVEETKTMGEKMTKPTIEKVKKLRAELWDETANPLEAIGCIDYLIELMEEREGKKSLGWMTKEASKLWDATDALGCKLHLDTKNPDYTRLLDRFAYALIQETLRRVSAHATERDGSIKHG